MTDNLIAGLVSGLIVTVFVVFFRAFWLQLVYMSPGENCYKLHNRVAGLFLPKTPSSAVFRITLW